MEIRHFFENNRVVVVFFVKEENGSNKTIALKHALDLKKKGKKIPSHVMERVQEIKQKLMLVEFKGKEQIEKIIAETDGLYYARGNETWSGRKRLWYNIIFSPAGIFIIVAIACIFLMFYAVAYLITFLLAQSIRLFGKEKYKKIKKIMDEKFNSLYSSKHN